MATTKTAVISFISGITSLADAEEIQNAAINQVEKINRREQTPPVVGAQVAQYLADGGSLQAIHDVINALPEP